VTYVLLFLYFILGCSLVDTVHMGFIQSTFTHAMHRIWTISASKHDRYLAYYFKHAEWCHLLCTFSRSYYYYNTVVWYIEKTL